MRRIAISTLALLLLGLPPALAQPWSEEQIGVNFYQLMEQEWVPGFYLAVRENDAVLEHVTALVDAAFGSPPQAESLCPQLVGAGGSPKLDGGGLLTQWVGSGAPVPAILADVFAVNSKIGPGGPTPFGPVQAHTLDRVVIIDEFDFESLLTWIGEQGPLPFRLNDVERLWRALIGVAVPPHEDPTDFSVKHGHLVLFHLLKSLAADNSIELVASDMANDHVSIQIGAGSFGTISVQLVEIKFDVPASVVTALNVVGQAGGRAVVNMSWGLVHCGLWSDFVAVVDDGDQRFGTHVEFMTDRLSEHVDTSVRVVQAVCELEVNGQRLEHVYTGPEPNPCLSGYEPAFHVGLVTMAVHAVIDAALTEARRTIEILESGDVMFFASAGNQGLPYPMPPASFNEVIGVAACVTTPGAGAKKAGFSNAPDFGSAGSGQPGLIALGAWFEVPLGDPPALGYYGTSFAAPYAAAREATNSSSASLGCD